MSLIGTAVAVGLWLVVLTIVYTLAAYVVLFYLPSSDELPNGTVADAVFVFTAPLVLTVTWVAALRNR